MKDKIKAITITPERELQQELTLKFESLLKRYGDNTKTRMLIVKYTMGYMGASYGLHIDG